MDFVYVAYTTDKRLVKGKIAATNEEAAANLLNYGGYQVVSLKSVVRFFDTEQLLSRFSRIKPREIIMFSRQLALLLESGTDIVTSLELLQNQITNQSLKKVVGGVASDIRGGSSLSIALSKHPRAFSPMYHRTIAAGEQSGNLEIVLRQMADHLERGFTTGKDIKTALTYPSIVAVAAVLVVGILATFVLPAFTSLYSQFGTEVPPITKMVLNMADWFSHYGLYLMLVFIAAIGAGYAYIRTPAGKYQWDKLSLRLPVVGRIIILGELSRCCRTMALLVRVGLPLPEILNQASNSSNNKAIEEALTEVRQEMLKGEGLSRPMAKRGCFLPLMVQMVGVGEETGNLDNTLATVAESFEAEADDKISSAVALIQPVITVFIGVVVAVIALALVSAMYSIYGQI